MEVSSYPDNVKLATYIFALSMFFISFVQLFFTIFQAFEEMKYRFVVIAAGTIILLVLSLFALSFGMGLSGLALAFLLSGFIQFIIAGYIIWIKFTTFKPKLEIEFCKILLKESFPLALVGAFVIIYSRIGIILLSLMKDDTSVAMYNAAYNIIIGLAVIPWSFLSAVFPVMSRFFVAHNMAFKKVYKTTFKYMLMLVLPISIILTFEANKIIFILYGEDYANSVASLQILAWGGLFLFLNNTSGITINAINRQKINTLIIAVGVILNITLNYLLIPSLNYVGASITLVATEAFIALCGIYYLSRQNYTLSVEDTTKIVVSCLPLIIFIWKINTNLILGLVIALGSYIVSLFVFKGISMEDIQLLRSTLNMVLRKYE